MAAIENGFSEKGNIKRKEEAELVESLYQQIGRLKVELDWLKKKWDCLSESNNLKAVLD